MRCVTGRGSTGRRARRPRGGTSRRPGPGATFGRPQPELPWTAGDDTADLRDPDEIIGPGVPTGRPSVGVRVVATPARPAVLLAVGVLLAVARRRARGDGRGARDGRRRLVTTPFLSYSPPPGWSTAPRPGRGDRRAGAGAASSTVRATRAATRSSCAASPRRPCCPPTRPPSPADRAERVARWFAATSFSAADGTPPDVTVSPPRSVRVAGPDGPVDGTVTEATSGCRPGATAAPRRRAGCSCWRCRASGGAALLLAPATPRAARPSPPHRARRRSTRSSRSARIPAA